MEISNSSTQFDIFELYQRFCDIKSGSAYPVNLCGSMLDDESEKAKVLRDAMFQFSNMFDLTMDRSVSILDELRKLMSRLNVMGHADFKNLYEFVFFVCREPGQKNITVSKAVAAWRLVLAGRFRLLDQWCDFVEKNQRYNISEDTWCQVFEFSRNVHEDLAAFDPEGAWPSLIDDFVEHMYRSTGSGDWSRNFSCNCSDPENHVDIFPRSGLKKLPGSKRKFIDDPQHTDLDMCDPLSSNVGRSIMNLKRIKQQENKLGASRRDFLDSSHHSRVSGIRSEDI